jgi:hypothetical protein
MGRGLRNIEKRKNFPSRSSAVASAGKLRYASPIALGASATGSKYEPLDVSIVPGRLRETVLRLSRGGVGRPLAEITIPRI